MHGDVNKSLQTSWLRPQPSRDGWLFTKRLFQLVWLVLQDAGFPPTLSTSWMETLCDLFLSHFQYGESGVYCFHLDFHDCPCPAQMQCHAADCIIIDDNVQSSKPRADVPGEFGNAYTVDAAVLLPTPSARAAARISVGILQLILTQLQLCMSELQSLFQYLTVRATLLSADL